MLVSLTSGAREREITEARMQAGRGWVRTSVSAISRKGPRANELWNSGSALRTLTLAPLTEPSSRPLTALHGCLHAWSMIVQ